MSDSGNNTNFLVDPGLERSLFVGLVLGAIMYGVHICIFITAVYYTHIARARKYRVQPLWSTVTMWLLFILRTFHIAGAINFFQRMWIDKRGLPGGPLQWLIEDYGDPVNTLSSASGPPIHLVQDAALFYRLITIYHRTSFRAILAIFLLPIMLASIVFSVLIIIECAEPNNTALWTLHNTSLSITHCSLSIGLNMLMTLLIVARLVYLRQTIVTHLGAKAGKSYTSIVAMVMESAAVYSVFGFICIIGHAVRSDILNVAIYALLQGACVSTDLIALRVALGHAMTHKIASLGFDQHDDITRGFHSSIARNRRLTRNSQTLTQICFSAGRLGQDWSGVSGSDGERESPPSNDVPRVPTVTVDEKEITYRNDSLACSEMGSDDSLTEVKSQCEAETKVGQADEVVV